MKMKPEIKQVWVDALRSGEYAQIQGRLCNGNGGYCCLGVLTDLHAKSQKKRAFNQFGTYTQQKLDADLLPKRVAKWAGFSEDVMSRVNNTIIIRFDYKGEEVDLSGLNDDGYSFKHLADIIEKEL